MRYGIIIVGVVVLLVVLGSTLRGHDSAPYTPDASYTETTQPNTIQYGMFDFAMPVGSDTRTGVRYVPESFLSSGGAVVFVLHGGQLGSGEKVAEQTNFEEHADRDGFMVVYPDALGDQWSDGRPETDTGVDDLGYIKVLVDEVVRTHGVRTDRVFVTGISNGGMMTQWLACNQVHDFAALAPVVANLPVEAKEVCRPTQIPTVLFHGTEDSNTTVLLRERIRS